MEKKDRAQYTFNTGLNKGTIQMFPKELVKPKLDSLTELSRERIEEMRAYAEKLHKKFPKMKEKRLMRKTAEFFKIKLVDDDSESN